MLFPIGVATGDAFCNRENERQWLKDNIHAHRHTVILAPRRYGKTSLVSEVIQQMNLVSAAMDFLLIADAQAAEAMIAEKIGQLIFQLLPKTQKAKEKLLAIFKDFKPEISLSTLGQKVVLHSPTTLQPNQSNHAENVITHLLLKLNELAKAAKKTVIVFMDEFQQVGELKDKHTIEASIRHAVERSESVSYIFSGSNRHLLLQMFSDKNRPFYKLCHVMQLNRIRAASYTKYIQQQAQKKWRKPLTNQVLQHILTLSECHSFYVNLICNYFWQKNQYPTLSNVEQFWQGYLDSQRPMIAFDIASLSNNQKAVLKDLALYPAKQPYSQENLNRTRLTIASQKEAIKRLKLKDFIFEDSDGYLRVLDPAMSAMIVASLN